jgi:hypothetical protein
MTWFGIVETATGDHDRPLVRIQPDTLTPPVDALTGKGAPSGPATPASPPARRGAPPARPAAAGQDRDGVPLRVVPDGTVHLRQPSPVRVWSLLLFADPDTLGEVSTWRLSEGALGRALAAGFELGQVTDFLTRQSGRSLPDTVTADLQGWASRFRRVRLGPAVTMRPDDTGQVADLVRVAEEAGLVAHPLPGPEGLVVITLPADGHAVPSEDALARLRERLRAAGFHPA